ncbi:magnetosome protein MamC [Thiocystis violascens]|uniref:Uncharacterized protein n=1 Tax=Thiocystis violascens (strain ATCC 17096 / DSM 198 / 6111) TaxID=765911 RepID=I3Y8N0_THIV6|nr:magnetosome protein MamC [Thiocystis violascens]AFL73348.1 hypothetical protein Thivi_1335 [Thiocystis violascens DSM 198]
MSVTYETRNDPVPMRPAYPAQPHAALDCAALMRLATTGAIVGGSAAAAHQVRRFRSGTQTPQGALAETAKAAAIAGVATVAAGAVASSVAEQGFGRLGLMFLVGTAVVYGIQTRLAGSEGES